MGHQPRRARPRTRPRTIAAALSAFGLITAMTLVAPFAGTASAAANCAGGNPRITALNPNSGPDFGGTSVTIIGANLGDAQNQPALGVLFGSAAALDFGYDPNGSLFATAPGANPGVVQVTVQTCKGTSNGVPYTYIAPPRVDSVSPSSGPGSGGTDVLINGSGFTGTTDVEFTENGGGDCDGEPCCGFETFLPCTGLVARAAASPNTPASNFHVLSDTQIAAATPGNGGFDEDVFVVVTNAAGQSDDNVTFHYTGQPPNSTVQGHVTKVTGGPVPNASVNVCGGIANTCQATSTDNAGFYSIFPLYPGDYTATAFPPFGAGLLQGSNTGNAPNNGSGVIDIALAEPQPISPCAKLSSQFLNADGSEVINWQAINTLVLKGAPGQTPHWAITSVNTQTGQPETATDTNTNNPFVESPAGTYTATIPALFPLHGAAHLSVTGLDCPPGSGTPIGGDFYIDPSGRVVDQSGAPVRGAKVTLLRADTPSGPLVAVPNHSALMSPANRTNPDTTNRDGQFGWDVVAGFYQVTATKGGCTQGATDVLDIPPPVTDLVIVLNCKNAIGSQFLSLASSVNQLVGDKGLRNDLLGKLRAAGKQLSAGHSDQACKKLAEFSKRVNDEGKRKNGKITAANAATLVGQAADVAANIGCP